MESQDDKLKNFNIPEYVLEVMKGFHDDGYEIYLVGGCVRDMLGLLNRTPHDWDCCTNATPDKIIECLSKHNFGYVSDFQKHGTIIAVNQGNTVEITTYRLDGEYSDNRHPDNVEFTSNLFEDLKRRDFTVNAMAFDPFVKRGLLGAEQGLIDMWNEEIRCVGDPDERFKEDALRILRALRFACVFHFTIEPKTAESIHRNKDLLKNISAERIKSELFKMTSAKLSARIFREFADVIFVVLPWLKPCYNYDQNNPWHIYDLYNHQIIAMERFASQLSREQEEEYAYATFALLIHDIGKINCRTTDENGVSHYRGHGVESARIFKEEIAPALKLSNDEMEKIYLLILHHDDNIDGIPNKKRIRRIMSKIGPDMAITLLHFQAADSMAHIKTWYPRIRNDLRTCRDLIHEIIAEDECFQMKDMKINGNKIMELGVKPGIAVGVVKKRLFDMVVDGDLANTEEALEDTVKTMINEVNNQY